MDISQHVSGRCTARKGELDSSTSSFRTQDEVDDLKETLGLGDLWAEHGVVGDVTVSWRD